MRPVIPQQASGTGEILSDAEAMKEIALGRVSGLAVLYDRYHACLYRFFANATNHGGDEEDLVQSTFLSVTTTAAAFDGRENCRPWLFAIATGVLFRRRRTLARWSRALRDFALTQTGIAADAERRLLARDQLNATARALSKLSEKKRVVLLLADLEGLPCEEIARVLEVPIGTVWTRLHHARNELRMQLSLEDVS